MSAVDVLAVMDEAQEWLYHSSECRGDDERAAAVKDARAAVAELIEGFKLIESAKARGFGIDYAQGVAVAALARAGGAA